MTSQMFNADFAENFPSLSENTVSKMERILQTVKITNSIPKYVKFRTSKHYADPQKTICNPQSEKKCSQFP